jgi:hypothetical protein
MHKLGTEAWKRQCVGTTERSKAMQINKSLSELLDAITQAQAARQPIIEHEPIEDDIYTLDELIPGLTINKPWLEEQ